MLKEDLKVLMKKCSSCQILKPVENFNKDSNSKDGLQYYCKDCNKNYFKKNKSRLTGLVITKRKEYNAERLQFTLKFLKEKGCVDCGESDPIVLEFDHVRGEKINSISKMVQCAYSITKIKEEIDKCEVRCANCHRRKTANQLNWYESIDWSKI